MILFKVTSISVVMNARNYPTIAPRNKSGQWRLLGGDRSNRDVHAHY